MIVSVTEGFGVCDPNVTEIRSTGYPLESPAPVSTEVEIIIVFSLIKVYRCQCDVRDLGKRDSTIMPYVVATNIDGVSSIVSDTRVTFKEDGIEWGDNTKNRLCVSWLHFSGALATTLIVEISLAQQDWR